MYSYKYDFRKSCRDPSNRYVGVGCCRDCWNSAYAEDSQYRHCAVTLQIYDIDRVRFCPFIIIKGDEFIR